MKLIGSLTSPFVRKIRIALIEKNIPFELVIDPPMELGTRVPDYNPLGKIPVLIDNDGVAWYDSDLLTEYLEAQFPQIPLLPSDRRAALPVRQTLKLADGVADAGVSIYLEKRRSADKQEPQWIERQRKKIERGLAALDAIARDKTYVHNDVFSAADIAIGCVLQWLEFRLSELQWRAQYPALLALFERLSARPSFAQTVPVV
ncbi:MAG TPA: glutathione S-transferase [Spongiibacteraceae bacterium]|nr:glutathione S-transferase [Spongiibacteraceae bacterium]